jgi:hypothetical protein
VHAIDVQCLPRLQLTVFNIRVSYTVISVHAYLQQLCLVTVCNGLWPHVTAVSEPLYTVQSGHHSCSLLSCVLLFSHQSCSFAYTHQQRKHTVYTHLRISMLAQCESLNRAFVEVAQEQCCVVHVAVNITCSRNARAYTSSA